MTEKVAFYIELPGLSGKRFYTPTLPAVIEAYTNDREKYPYLHVVGPAEIKARWQSFHINSNVANWKEVAGPARLITEAEWKKLMSDG